MNEMRKFKFIKPYVSNFGTFKEGDEIVFFRGLFYFNGMMIVPSCQNDLRSFIEKELKEQEYLKEIKLVKNEF